METIENVYQVSCRHNQGENWQPEEELSCFIRHEVEGEGHLPEYEETKVHVNNFVADGPIEAPHGHIAFATEVNGSCVVGDTVLNCRE